MQAADIRPMRSLGLLSVAHAINHAQAVLLPLIFLAIIDEFGVGVETIAFLAAIGGVPVRRRPAELRRPDPGRLAPPAARRRRDPVRWRVRAAGAGDELPDVRHPERRCRGSAARRSTRSATACSPSSSRPSGAASRSARTSPAATSGRSSSRSSASRSSPRSAGAARRSSSGCRPSPSRSRSCCSSASAARTGRRPCRAARVRAAFGRILRDRDLRWLYLTSALGGGGRGLGVVNLFALIYMTRVLGLDEATSGLMYGALIVFSVPMPLVAGWLSDRVGRKPLIIGVYLGGAVGVRRLPAAGIVAGLAVGRDRADGPVHVRREPAAPGAARRHRAAVDPRRVVRALLRDGVRRRVALVGRLRRRSSRRSARRRACRSCSC